jgi:hypothetical protein
VSESDANDKLSHATVEYLGVSAHPGRHCSVCEYFIKADAPRCESVQSPIAAKGWCDLFQFANAAQRSGMRG